MRINRYFIMFVFCLCNLPAWGLSSLCVPNSTLQYGDLTVNMDLPRYLYKTQSDYNALRAIETRPNRNKYIKEHGLGIYACDQTCGLGSTAIVESGHVFGGASVSGKKAYTCTKKGTYGEFRWTPVSCSQPAVIADYINNMPNVKEYQVTCSGDKVVTKCADEYAVSADKRTCQRKCVDDSGRRTAMPGTAKDYSCSGTQSGATGFANAATCGAVCSDGKWVYGIKQCNKGFHTEGAASVGKGLYVRCVQNATAPKKPDPQTNNSVSACKTSSGDVQPGSVIEASCTNPIKGMENVTFPGAVKCGIKCVNGDENEWVAGIIECQKNYKPINPVGDGLYGKCEAPVQVPTCDCDAANAIFAAAQLSCIVQNPAMLSEVVAAEALCKPGATCTVDQLEAYVSHIKAEMAKCPTQPAVSTTPGVPSKPAFDANKITNAVANIDGRVKGLDTSVWKNAEGKFNTARLASDSIAGAVLGTAGGLITSSVVKKNQVKKGFEDISCTIGDRVIGGYGDEIRVGIQ